MTPPDAPGPAAAREYPEWFDDVDQIIHERPHPAEQGVIRYRRCLTCCCDTRAEALMCLAHRSRRVEVPTR